jgi:hypothetical protein
MSVTATPNLLCLLPPFEGYGIALEMSHGLLLSVPYPIFVTI